MSSYAVPPEVTPRRLRVERAISADPFALVSAPQVLRIQGCSRATLARRIAKGTFPPPDKVLPGGLRFWRRATVEAWLLSA